MTLRDPNLSFSYSEKLERKCQNSGLVRLINLNLPHKNADYECFLPVEMLTGIKIILLRRRKHQMRSCTIESFKSSTCLQFSINEFPYFLQHTSPNSSRTIFSFKSKKSFLSAYFPFDWMVSYKYPFTSVLASDMKSIRAVKKASVPKVVETKERKKT